MAENPFYVYALKDPREKPALPFYIGKGTGARVFEHEKEDGNSDKNIAVQQIIDAGLKIIHVVLADNLTENQALKIEAELISAFGVKSNGGLLTNRVKPSGIQKDKIKVNIPIGCYEKAQMSLEMLKDCVLEMARANQEGITNSDISKYLGLHSDYGGGSKDYLSYSLLGILMKEGKLKRIEKKRHVALTK